MRLAYFTMAVQPAAHNPKETLRDDRVIIILAGQRWYHDAFAGEQNK